MKLTREEYRRGLVSWNPAVRATFRVGTSESDEEESRFSSPLTESSGSKADCPPGRYCQLELRMTTENPVFDHTIPLALRWERESDNIINTRMWVGDLMEVPTTLAHIPNLGIYFRLVVKTPYLLWDDDVVLRVGNSVVRLIQGAVRGERVTPFDHIERSESGISIAGGDSVEAAIEGKFVEIVVPGCNFEEAELRAFAILGLLALLLGRQAVGEILFAERYEAVKGKQLGSIEVPVAAQLPRKAALADLDMTEAAIEHLLAENTSTRAVTLALRWYERGLRSHSEIDRLLSFFVGIEVLVNSSTKGSLEKIPEVGERTSMYEKLRGVIKKHDDEGLVKWLRNQKQRLIQPSMVERFRIYIENQGLDRTTVAILKRVAKARNDLVHGELVELKHVVVVDAKELLESMLSAALALPKSVAKKVPHVDLSVVTYELMIQQWHQHTPPDSPAAIGNP